MPTYLSQTWLNTQVLRIKILHKRDGDQGIFDNGPFATDGCRLKRRQIFCSSLRVVLNCKAVFRVNKIRIMIIDEIKRAQNMQLCKLSAKFVRFLTCPFYLVDKSLDLLCLSYIVYYLFVKTFAVFISYK